MEHNINNKGVEKLLSVLKIHNLVENNIALHDLAKNYQQFENKIKEVKENDTKDVFECLPSDIANLFSYNSSEYKVFMDGCFDLLHSGHFNAIRQASKLGDQLYIGLVTDEDIIKHKEFGLMKIDERARLVNACKWVNGIYKDVPYVPIPEFLDKNKLDCIAHGDDPCLGLDGEDVYKEFKKLNKYREFKRTEGVSTTDIVGRLLMKGMDLQREHDEKIVLQKFTAPTSSGLLGTVERFKDFSEKKNYNSSKKNAYVCGAFDILQVGHIDVFDKIALLEMNLYVGVFDDRTVNELYGKHFPILNVVERSLNVLALKYVSDIVVGTPWPPSKELIKSLGINLVIEVKCTAPTYPKINLDYDPYADAKELGIYKEITTEFDISPMKIIQTVMENKEAFVKKFTKKKNC